MLLRKQAFRKAVNAVTAIKRMKKMGLQSAGAAGAGSTAAESSSPEPAASVERHYSANF